MNNFAKPKVYDSNSDGSVRAINPKQSRWFKPSTEPKLQVVRYYCKVCGCQLPMTSHECDLCGYDNTDVIKSCKATIETIQTLQPKAEIEQSKAIAKKLAEQEKLRKQQSDPANIKNQQGLRK